MWTARILLEALSHVHAGTFFTLTYGPEFLPAGGTLVPAHLEGFRSALRYRVGPYRYYFVGEYGEQRCRPHYHGIVFGKALTREQLLDCWPFVDREKCLEWWASGKEVGVHVGTVTAHSAAYMAGYVCKKMTKAGDPRLGGRHPEFSRMSLKRGIGIRGLEGILDWLYSEEGARYVARTGDVPSVLRFEGKVYPLGRYLVQVLREHVGVGDTNMLRSGLQVDREVQRTVPEVAFSREVKRENEYWRATAYVKLKRSMEKL